jgi:hypothetical protein
VKGGRGSEQAEIAAGPDEEEQGVYLCIIRVRFPDRLLLQGSFLVLEAVNDLYAFVAEALVQTRKFELFMAPPRQVIHPS